MIDDKDRQILAILQENARTSNADIARSIGMAQSGTLERVRKLEERGVIQGYEARVDPRAVGRGLLAFIQVRTDQGPGHHEAALALAQMPEVLEVHHIAGEDCYLIKVRAADTAAVGELLRERFAAVGDVVSTRTTIVLETLKETGALPLGDEADEGDAR